MTTTRFSLIHGWAVVDRSPERTVERRVASAWTDDDDGAKFHVRTEEALGWTWRSGDAELIVGGAASP